MEYSKIIAVTGLPGLFELLNSKADGAIVRSLEDKSSKFVSSRIHNFSHLESIEVFTVRENVNLVDVLKAMEASSEKLPDEKDAAALKKYFSKVYPDLDQDRVYSSDLKKMVKWFSVLKSNNVEIKLTEPAEEEPVVEEIVEEKKEPAPKKKAAVKEEKETEEKPAKKPVAKKAAEEPKEKKEAKKEKPEAEAKPKKAPAKKKSDK
ncbi:MAG: DUF5606 domain-containing protein [Bacteroidetes bacterium]|nr:DUF5606 domain-containing protein [Bacteroidota bacterium]